MDEPLASNVMVETSGAKCTCFVLLVWRWRCLLAALLLPAASATSTAAAKKLPPAVCAVGCTPRDLSCAVARVLQGEFAAVGTACGKVGLT